MLRFAVWGLLIGSVGTGVVRGQAFVSGAVVDAQTGAGLAAAHLTVVGTAMGTITNAAGRFDLAVDRLPVVLEVRYIGYVPQQVTVVPGAARDVMIRMTPQVVQLGEVVVGTSDFAENIMRKVLARKAADRARLATYEAQVFSRLTLAREGTIVLMAEAVADFYWDRTRGPRVVITAERETSALHDALDLQPAAPVPTFTDDRIDVRGLAFMGPTHPRALDVYAFNLAGARQLGDQTVYDLYVAPRTDLEAAFIGTISVLDGAYVLVGVDLRPARHVRFPEPTRAWAVGYQQQFRPFGDSLWLPVDLRMAGTGHIDPGVGYQPARVEQTIRLTGHRVNEPLPAAFYAEAEVVTMDSLAVMNDPLFLSATGMVPMTPREEAALDRLRRQPMTLAQALLPRGRFAPFALFQARRYDDDDPQFRWPLLFGLYQPELRFNRVDGYLAAIGQEYAVTPQLQLGWQLGQASGLQRVRYHAYGRMRWGRGGSVAAGYHVDTDEQYSSAVYPRGLNTVAALFGAGAYFDYLWARQAAVDVRYAFPRVRFAVGYRHAEHELVDRTWRRSLVPGDDPMRRNPPVDAGRWRAVQASVAWGAPAEKLRTGRLARAGAAVEHSLPSLGSAFTYTRVEASADAALRTLYPRRLQPNALHLRLRAGTAWGTVPPQRRAALDGTLGVFAGFGAFRALRGRPYTGTRYAALFWAHDFQTVPFEALRLRPLVDRSMGLRLFGAHGRMDAGALATGAPRRASAGWHHEVGVGLTNVLGMPLRVDLTRRLDTPGWFVTVGVSRLRW